MTELITTSNQLDQTITDIAGQLAPSSKKVFEAGYHAVLQQEEHRHGTFTTLFASKALNTYQCELRKCLIPMKSALSQKKFRSNDR